MDFALCIKGEPDESCPTVSVFYFSLGTDADRERVFEDGSQGGKMMFLAEE